MSAPAQARATPLLQVIGARKSYGGAVALAGADLTISRAGAVHCLAGENGSGKSTLMGILSGSTNADAGRLSVDGTEVSFRSPHQALAHGIAMVSQETAIAPHLSVTENVLLGRRLVRSVAGINWRRSAARATDVLARLGLDYDPRSIVGDLSPDKRQMVEIARAVSMDARILILDEPTSSLTDDEVDGLLRTIRQLTTEGVAVLFVSHRLPEVFAVCTELTVLRDGRTVSEGPIGNYTPATLVDAMIGRPAAARSAPVAAGRHGTDVILRTDGVTADGFTGVDLTVHAGEVVGLAGLVASGRSELLETIFGTRRATAGTIELGGAPYRPGGPGRAMRRGVGYLPPDRKTQGLVLPLGAAENLSMACTSQAGRLRPPDRRQEDRRFEEARTAMTIRTSSARAPVQALSGGNQQKVALGKWLARRPSLLLLDEPTRGVDVAAKADIHARLRKEAEDGMAMVVSSSEYDELLALCTRIVVMFAGHVVADVPRSDATEPGIAALAGGQL